jgi:hypothetical protein
LRPGLLERGAAQNGGTEGGLDEFATVAHACLLLGRLEKRKKNGL